MENIKKLQEALIIKTRRFHPITKEIENAFYKYPRHEFVPSRYSLGEAYSDSPLALYQDRTQRSTISQPSFVLFLLDLLNLHHGQKVFEVGTGSGWNAALMSSLVGPEGLIVSMEIIPELVQKSQDTLQRLNIKNVRVIEGDAGFGWEPEAPYDRMIFTAAARRMPGFVMGQLKDGGRALYVQEGSYGVDEIQVLEKHQGQFTCVQKVPCRFVPMTGSAINESNIPPS